MDNNENDIRPNGFKKYDSGKIKPTLVPVELEESVAEVMAFGAKKYGKDNWKLCTNPTDYLDAAIRHCNAIRRGEIVDPESGLKHAAHWACNVAFYLWFLENKPYLFAENSPVDEITQVDGYDPTEVQYLYAVRYSNPITESTGIYKVFAKNITEAFELAQIAFPDCNLHSCTKMKLEVGDIVTPETMTLGATRGGE